MVVFDHMYNFQCTFEDLPGYEQFSVSVVACTIACSPPSRTINVTTEIGCKYKIFFLENVKRQKVFFFVDPSKVEKAMLASIEQENVVISWKTPAIPAGKNDFYEVLLSEKHLLGDNTSEIFNVTGKF